MRNENELTYGQVGDYLITNLTLPPEEVTIHLGKWGILHKDYLRKHKPVVFAKLLAQGKLWQYLADIDTQAREMFDTLIEQLKEREGVTEQLKEENQMLWVQMMNIIQNRANEIVCKVLIFK
ncbi:MAG: TnpV protein [Acutalibacteraceae bacterium]